MADRLKYLEREILNKVLNTGEDALKVDIDNVTLKTEGSDINIEVHLDKAEDSVVMFSHTVKTGTGGTSYVPLVDSDGHLQVDVLSSGLPSGGATAANQATMITALQLIDNVVHVDDAGFTLGTHSGVMMMGFAGTQSVDANDAGAIAMETDGSIHIHDGGNTITVDGTVTANLSATDNAVLDTIDAVLDTIKVDTEAIETATEATQAAVEKTLYGTALAVTAVDGGSNHSLGATYEAFYIGVGGDIKLDCATSGSDILFRNVASGQLLPVRAATVKASGTTATGIVALKA
tara:strand:- start:291 stop:1163 length:873 start_codon:yes stop_codon:yes gene_type:complete